MTRSWRDVRDDLALDETQVSAERDRQMAQVRAYRLAELRARHALSQQNVAERMGVTQSRVSAIERGEVSAAEVDTVRKYVAALGGRVEIVADFGDERLVVG